MASILRQLARTVQTSCAKNSGNFPTLLIVTILTFLFILVYTNALRFKTTETAEPKQETRRKYYTIYVFVFNIVS